MLSVSSRFAETEQSDVNQIASRIYLVLGNYASDSGSSASASSSDGSGNYPASGTIDGDRTELNVGPASAADNDLGKSSWRSATAPSVTPQTLTINFGQSRTINRIKLYHLASHAMKSYKLEYSTDSFSYTLIDKTTDQGGTITTTNEVDTIDFTEVTCQYVKLTVSDTVAAADKANVVEIECYRKVDITSRVISAKLNRSRDYKLQNPLASTFSIDCDNSDRFFSFSHSPTSSESSSGFVNAELQPNIGVIIQHGFAYGGDTPELVTVMNGFVDRLRVDSARRVATIEGRDGMKTLINQIISSKLTTAKDIKSCVKYALNLANISDWETNLDTTGINIDYFFINNQSIATVIRDLVQASEDALFWFDENGIAQFKDYAGAVPLSHLDSTESDFEAGTVLTNIDTTGTPSQIGRKWFLVDDFADGEYFINPVWNNHVPTQSVSDTTESDFEAGTVFTNIDTTSTPNQIGGKWFLIDDFADGDPNHNPVWTSDGRPTWEVISGAAHYTAPGKIGHTTGVIGISPSTSDGLLSTPCIQTTGTWRFRVNLLHGLGEAQMKIFFMHNGKVNQSPFNTTTFSHRTYKSGYFLSILTGQFVHFGKTDEDGTETILATANTTVITSGPYYSIRITRDSAGNMAAYIDEVHQPLADCADTSIVSCSSIGVVCLDGNGDTVNDWANYDFDDVYYSPTLDGTGTISTDQPVFESRVFDQSATIVSEGIFQATENIPAGCMTRYYTATSADGVTFPDGYIAVTNGGQIQSAPRRYIKYKVVLTRPVDNGTNANFSTPTVQDVTISSTVVGWSISSHTLQFAPGTSNAAQTIDTVLQRITGTWRTLIQMTIGTATGEIARMYFLTTGYDVTAATYVSGYYVEVNQSAGSISLYKINSSGSRTSLATTAKVINGSQHSLRVTRDSAGLMTVYWDEISQISATDTGFSSSAVLGLEIDPASDQNGHTQFDDIYYSPAVDGTIAISTNQPVFESQVIDATASLTSYGLFQATTDTPTGSSLAFYTATSADGVTFDSYVAVSPGGAIASATKRYIKWKAVFTAPIDDGLHNANLVTPSVFDVTLNWFISAGSPKYPTTVSYTLKYSDAILAIAQEYADTLGGDSAIINDVNVQAKPLYLSGANTDTQWQGTVQTPPVAISVSNPLSVTNGQTLTYYPVISSGMDTSLMSGASPAAAAITFAGGGAGSWVFSTIHPTRPVLVITITGTGSITDLRLIGKQFSNSNTLAVQNSKDTNSIKQYGDRQMSISNQYIVNTSIAALVASKFVSNFKNPTSYIPGVTVRPTFSAQIGDRVTIVDDNTDISADYVIAGVQHEIMSNVTSAQSQTDFILLKVA